MTAIPSLQSILDAAERATPGPWMTATGGIGWPAVVICGLPKVGSQFIAETVFHKENASYIALMSPDTTTALVERLMKAEAALAHFACGCPGKCERLGPSPDSEPDDLCMAHDALIGDSQ